MSKLPYLQPLPRQATPVEVHQDVPKRLEIVAATLLDAEVRVDAGVPGSASQVFIFSVRDVLRRPQRRKQQTANQYVQ